MALEAEILDAKLLVALDEIVALLEKHKIAGAISLASSTHAGFRLHFPDWSCVTLHGPHGVFVKAKGEADTERLGASLHMLFSLTELTQLHSVQLTTISQRVSEAVRAHGVEITRGPDLTGTDDGTQN